VPTPPFWGPKLIEYMPVEIVLQHIHKPELFRLSWGAKNAHGAEWEQLEAEFEARLEKMIRAAVREKSLRPQAVYGYFPVNSDGDDLIVWDYRPFESSVREGLRPSPTQNGNRPELIEVARFSFPRQQQGEFLCISDYFAPADSGQVDTMALQIVTVGEGATQKFDELQSADNYSEAYYYHGLAVQGAEATATYTHKHVTRELGIPANQGKRYSWGYPACPDLEDHQLVMDLLPQARELGLQLTESFQWVPEQSTAAIVVHHPDAKYYSVGNLDRSAMILGEG
jgi:5-methyltetrahydrofolate--homocysteine methyltransferase